MCAYKVWQARRDSNPQPSDLESDALAVELLPCVTGLLRLAVHSVLLVPGAILLELETTGRIFLVLLGRVVLALALGALQDG